MRQILIFDFDGVLCDSLQLVITESNLICSSLGAKRTLDTDAFNELTNVTFPEIARLTGIKEEHVPAYVSRIFEALQHKSQELELFFGIREMCSSLASDFRLAVITANHPEVVHRLLQKAGIDTCFEEILGGDRPGTKAEKIIALLEELGMSSADATMVGDALSDISAGKQAEVRTLAVSWGWQEKDILQSANPDYIAHSPEDLLHYVRSSKELTDLSKPSLRFLDKSFV